MIICGNWGRFLIPTQAKERGDFMFEKSEEISLENYIINIIDGDGSYSICREERQYAFYLCNVLRYYGKAEHRNNNINK